MNYKIIEKMDKKYIKINQVINTEEDVLEIIGICISNNTKLVILKEDAISDEFINLKSGLAGIALQKFINYHIKASIIINKDKIEGRFKELVYELNKSNNFKVFDNIIDAENWILNIKQ
ncbi:TPA: DUF4180 domain-containing protein [Clostridium perfringens]|nr:DUF4180 domain-containing protein [Clostridium perfringens]